MIRVRSSMIRVLVLCGCLLPWFQAAIVVGATNNTFAGKCGGGNEKDWGYRGDSSKTCAKWVRKKKKVRCQLKETKGNHRGKLVKEICPRTCNYTIRRAGRCGKDDQGYKIQQCNKSKRKWETMGCLEYNRLHGGGGFGPAEWDYDQAPAGSHGVYGWSYYIRAFDLIRDTPVREFGWGQWSKPGEPELKVCGLHPHGFTCEETDDDEWQGSLKGCGSTDFKELVKCKEWCCGEDDKCGVRGSIEGGMGYWMYTLETPHVKYMLPGATNANYEIFGGTFLNDRQQPCTNLGGAARISNRMLIPNSFVHFDSQGGDIDGFMGYMLTRTPIGKRSEEDEANYWTIIIDANNFSGPVMYMTAWFWDQRINWHPKSVSWSDPRALIAYIAQGFEGSIGSKVLTQPDGQKWIKTNEVQFPRDNGSETTTLFTGHSQFHSDWATEAMEPMLSGTGSQNKQTVDHVLKTYQKKRLKPECLSPEEYSRWSLETDETEDEPESEIIGFGIGDEVPAEGDYLDASNEASCHTRLSLDTDKLSCDNSWCRTTKYIYQKKHGNDYSPLTTKEVPKDTRRALDLLDFEPSRQNDGRYLGPPDETEKVCFNEPGPADSRLYCTRTQSGTWIGFKWYRFVDQPELNQVFASIKKKSERDEARCFMQARIERLHDAQNSDTRESIPHWFDAPQGAEELPKEKVSIDPALLLTPPVGMEEGFVPIPVYERNREMPDNCDVFVGDVTSEPNPLSEDYYEGYAWEDGWYDAEICPANPESGGEYSYPGKIFGYHPSSDQSARRGYLVPTRNEVKLDKAITCGLPSDP